MIKQERIFLGIDPGCRIAGFAVVRKRGRITHCLSYGIIKLKASAPLHNRIALLYDEIAALIKQYHVTDISLETPFLGKNAQNFLKLGYVRGIIYLLVAQKNLMLHEYAPPEVKQAVTGYGNAGKDQVSRIILQLFPHLKSPETADATDALAIAVCGMWRAPVHR